MKLRNVQLFLALSITVLFVAFFAIWNIQNNSKSTNSFRVRILPLTTLDEAPPEMYYWDFQKSVFPQIKIPEPLPKGIPTNDNILYVSLEKNGEIKFNFKDFGNLDNTNFLSKKLSGIFYEREKIGIFEPGTDKIVKAIIIKVTLSAKYGDVVKVIDAVKSSGADPIILQIDDLPE